VLLRTGFRITFCRSLVKISVLPKNASKPGAWTNFSVEHSARHGADAGHEVIFATDGTSTIDHEWQQAAINYALRQIAERLTCQEILRALT
jgi:hypothetical protein